MDCTTTLHSIWTTADGSLHSNQRLQLGRSSVRGWTRQWPFGIPRRSAERGEASLKDTFPPLLHSNSIVLTGQRCPTVCQTSNLHVIEFPISHPSIMHLVSTRKEANALLYAGRRQKSAMTGQRDLLLPDDRSMALWRRATSNFRLLCYFRQHNDGELFSERASVAGRRQRSSEKIKTSTNLPPSQILKKIKQSTNTIL